MKKLFYAFALLLLIFSSAYGAIYLQKDVVGESVDLGRWTGGVKSQGNLPETWTAPTSLFDTEDKNENSSYTWTASTSTLTLPSSDLADGYLFVAWYEYHNTANDRFNPMGRFVQASGTGTFVSGAGSGYARQDSNDRAGVRTWAFVDNPSASATFQFQWKADLSDGTGGTDNSALDVIPLTYTDVGVYSSTSNSLYGGTTVNQVTGYTGTDGTNITMTSNVVTVTGDNKRYLILGSNSFEDGYANRTQRWIGPRIDGTKDDSAKGIFHVRDANNDKGGAFYTHIIETVTASVTIDNFAYTGDGFANGDGGADIDASSPTTGSHALVVIELTDATEVFHTQDDTGAVDLNVTGPVDVSISRTTGLNFNDSASWTRSTDSAMNAVVAMDALCGANIGAAQEDVTTTTRWTSYGSMTVDGTEDDDTKHVNYTRNEANPGNFGWGVNLLSHMTVAIGEDIGVSVQELSGGEDGGNFEIQPDWAGLWCINLDTM